MFDIYRDGLCKISLSLTMSLFVSCFEEYWIDCLFVIQLKQRMMKTASQEFVTFNEPII